jgi:hypothetical protein
MNGTLTRPLPTLALVLGLSLVGAASVVQAHGIHSHDTLRDWQLDARGNRVERQLDRRGDVIDRRLDRRANRAADNGNYLRAHRLDARGDCIDARLDRRGNRIDNRLDARAARNGWRYDAHGRLVQVWF